MKKINCLLLLLFLFQLNTIAQNKITRCATDEEFHQQEMMQPKIKAGRQAMLKKMKLWLQQNRNTLLTKTDSIFIPLVVHVLWNKPEENISDSQILSQIEVLNNDFNSMNADTVNTPAYFKERRGKTHFYFRLAKQDPGGMPTTGINRRYTFVNHGFGLGTQINYTDEGGQDPWDARYYINIYVCRLARSTNTFAVTYFPGGGLLRDGIICDYRYFGTVGITTPPYDKGRTITHEMGHYFNLDHIWGPTDKTALADCTDDDHVWDTPTQLIAHEGCPRFPKISCVPDTSDMFMNYMDYTNDACMNMFTRGQAERMTASFYVMTPYLKNSKALQPPVITSNDAGIRKIISPADNSYTCNDKIFPRVVIINYGSKKLKSVTIEYYFEGSSKKYNAVFGDINIPAYSTDTVRLTGITVEGKGSIKFMASATSPNGKTDENKTNDNASVFINRNSVDAQTLPFKENFSAGKFPPKGWSIINTDNRFTWTTTTGSLLSGYSPSVMMDNIEYLSVGRTDDLVTPPLDFSGISKPVLLFDHAFAVFKPGIPYSDSLKVMISKDCGNSWETVFYKGGYELSTATNDRFAYFSPDSISQWRTNTIDLSAFANEPNVLVSFENISGKDNIIYLDNINVKAADRTRPLPVAKHTSDCSKVKIVSAGTAKSFYVEGFNFNEKVTVKCINAFGETTWTGQLYGGNIFYLPQSLTHGMYCLRFSTKEKKCTVKIQLIK